MAQDPHASSEHQAAHIFHKECVHISLHEPAPTQPSLKHLALLSDNASQQVFLKQPSKSDRIRAFWLIGLGVFLLNLFFTFIRVFDQKILGAILNTWFENGLFTHLAASGSLSTVLILGMVLLSIILVFYLTRKQQADAAFQKDPLQILAACCVDENGASLLENEADTQALQKRMQKITEQFNQGRERKYTIQYAQGICTIAWNKEAPKPAPKKSLWKKYITEGGWYKEKWPKVAHFAAFMGACSVTYWMQWATASLITGGTDLIMGDLSSPLSYGLSFGFLIGVSFLIPLAIYAYKIRNKWKNKGQATASSTAQADITELAQYIYFSEQQRKAVEKLSSYRIAPSYAAAEEKKEEEKNTQDASPQNEIAPHLSTPPLKPPGYGATFRYGLIFFITVVCGIEFFSTAVMAFSVHITRSYENAFTHFLTTNPYVSASILGFSFLVAAYNTLAWHKQRKEEAHTQATPFSEAAAQAAPSVETLSSDVSRLQAEITLYKAKYKAMQLAQGRTAQDLAQDPVYNTQIPDAVDLENIIKPEDPSTSKTMLAFYITPYLFGALAIWQQIASALFVTRATFWIGTSIVDPTVALARKVIDASIPDSFLELSGFGIGTSIFLVLGGALLYAFMVLRQKKADAVYTRLKQQRSYAPLHARSLQAQSDALHIHLEKLHEALSAEVIKDAAEKEVIEKTQILSAFPAPDFSNRTLEKKQRLQHLYRLSAFVLYGLLVFTVTPFFSSAIFSATPYIQKLALLIVPLSAALIAHALHYMKHTLTPDEKSNLQLLFAGLVFSFVGYLFLYNLHFHGPASFSIVFLLPIVATGIFSLLFFKRDTKNLIADAKSAIARYETNKHASKTRITLESAIDAVLMAMHPRDEKKGLDIKHWNHAAFHDVTREQFLLDVMHLQYVRTRVIQQETILQKDLKKVETIFKHIKKASLKKEVQEEKSLPLHSLPVFEDLYDAIEKYKTPSANQHLRLDLQAKLKNALEDVMQRMQEHTQKEMDKEWTENRKTQFQEDIRYIRHMYLKLEDSLQKASYFPLQDAQLRNIALIAKGVESAIQKFSTSPPSFLISAEEKKRADIYSALFLLFCTLGSCTLLAALGLQWNWPVWAEAPLQGILLLFASIKLAANTQTIPREKTALSEEYAGEEECAEGPEENAEEAAAAIELSYRGNNAAVPLLKQAAKKAPPPWQQRLAVGVFLCALGTFFLAAVIVAILKNIYISPRWLASFIILPLVATPFLYRLLDHFFPGKFPRLAHLWENIKAQADKISLRTLTENTLLTLSFASITAGGMAAVFLGVFPPAFLAPWYMLAPSILAILAFSLLLAESSMRHALTLQKKTGSNAISKWQQKSSRFLTYTAITLTLLFLLSLIALLTASAFIVLPPLNALALPLRIALNIALISGGILSAVFFIRNKLTTVTQIAITAPAASVGLLVRTEESALEKVFSLTDLLFLPLFRSGHTLYTGNANTFEKVTTPLEIFALIASATLFIAKAYEKNGKHIPSGRFFLGGFFAVAAFREMHEVYLATENCNLHVQLRHRLEAYENSMAVEKIDMQKKEVLLKEIAALYFVDLKENPENPEREKLFARYTQTYREIDTLLHPKREATEEEKNFATAVLQTCNEKQTEALLRFFSAVTAAGGCMLWGAGYHFLSAGVAGDITRIVWILSGLIKLSEVIYASGALKQNRTVEKKREAFLEDLLTNLEDPKPTKNILKEKIAAFMWKMHNNDAFLPDRKFSEKEQDASVDTFMLACIHTPQIAAKFTSFLSPPVEAEEKQEAHASFADLKAPLSAIPMTLFYHASPKIRLHAVEGARTARPQSIPVPLAPRG